MSAILKCGGYVDPLLLMDVIPTISKPMFK